MRLRDCAFFADQNVNADVVVWMRRSGVDIMSAADESMSGALDDEILARATALGRVVITHDADFGKLAIVEGVPFLGIVFIRPGHLQPGPSIIAIGTLFDAAVDVIPPFIAVMKWSRDTVAIRVRHLPL